MFTSQVAVDLSLAETANGPAPEVVGFLRKLYKAAEDASRPLSRPTRQVQQLVRVSYVSTLDCSTIEVTIYPTQKPYIAAYFEICMRMTRGNYADFTVTHVA